MAEVALENVSRRFPDGTLAVDSVELLIRDREFMVLVGPSGCGKTTTLRMIAGLEDVSLGTVSIGGRIVNQVPPKDRDIAMVFQNYALYPHMTVRANMSFGLRLRYGGSLPARMLRRIFRPERAKSLEARRATIDEQVQAAASMLGIENLLERMPRQLSGGERQRVALGRAIVRRPAAFLFDEPLSNLDAKLRVEMRRELKHLHQQLQATMVYVTHDQVEALTLGDRIAVMDRGRVQQVGPAMEVYDRPTHRFVAGFLGTPPMNFVEGELRPGHGGLEFFGGGATIPWKLGEAASAGLAPGKIQLGIRPEDICLSSDGPISAVVELVEALGDATLIHGQLAQMSTALTIKRPGRATVSPGETVALDWDWHKVHWFDTESGESLLAKQKRS